MKSPITGSEMKVKNEIRQLTFRKDVFDVNSLFYHCDESGEKFTSDELDRINLLQVHNQYRDKYNLPFTEEIKMIRNKYRLSAVKMSEILGFGVNSYRNYENGEMPSISNGRIIQLVNDPKKFLSVVKMSEVFNGAQLEELISRITKLIDEEKKKVSEFAVQSYLIGDSLPGIYTGYLKPSLDKLTEMVVYFAQNVAPFKTKLNKLLFYSDFLSFRSSCFSMSGVKYRAIQLGPVPNNFNSLFEFMDKQNHIDVVQHDFGEDRVGDQVIAHPGRTFNSELFTAFEIDILKDVMTTFKDSSTSRIVEFSHNEKGWIENNESKNLISYNYAFDISQI